MQAWYVINTKPQSELRAYHALTTRGFETYLPLLPSRHADKGKAQPLFPAYLFVHCDLETLGVDKLQFVPGLRTIVSFGGRPAVLPDDAISMIRSKLGEIEARGGLPSHGFQPGDEVVIDKGPLAGLRGVFQGPLGPAARVEILIRFLGHTNRAEVPVELLRPPSQDRDEVRRRGTRGHGRRIRYHDDQPDAPDAERPPDGQPDDGN